MKRGKQLTWMDVERRKRHAEAFSRNVLEDDERADEIASESLDEYAERRRFSVQNNPRKVTGMPRTNLSQLSKQKLISRVKELEDENQTLNEKLDNIWDLASAELDDGDDDQDDEEEDDEED